MPKDCRRHCWHSSVPVWQGAMPPPEQCCWCGEATACGVSGPQPHGPHVPAHGMPGPQALLEASMQQYAHLWRALAQREEAACTS